jgi:DNA-directed RNA polymerase specialized sigma24 family protein
VKVDTRAVVERLYREQGQRLWRAVFLFTGDREVANDSVSEAFAQALRRGEAIRSPEPWVWKAAFRIAAGELKRRRRVAVVEARPDADQSQVSARIEALTAALPRLSPKQRAAVVLRYYGAIR